MAHLCTYLVFHGKAEEAFTHYHDVFGGKLEILHYSDMPPMDKFSSTTANSNAVAYASLELPGGSIAGEDSVESKTTDRGVVSSLMYELDEVSNAEKLISKLIDAGGTVITPLAPAPWGDYFATVHDKFGVEWSFNVPADQD